MFLNYLFKTTTTTTTTTKNNKTDKQTKKKSKSEISESFKIWLWLTFHTLLIHSDLSKYRGPKCVLTFEFSKLYVASAFFSKKSSVTWLLLFWHQSKALLQRRTRKSRSTREKTPACSAGKSGTNSWRMESVTGTPSPQVGGGHGGGGRGGASNVKKKKIL